MSLDNSRDCRNRTYLYVFTVEITKSLMLGWHKIRMTIIDDDCGSRSSPQVRYGLEEQRLQCTHHGSLTIHIDGYIKLDVRVGNNHIQRTRVSEHM